MSNRITEAQGLHVSPPFGKHVLPAVYPLIDNHRWYAENGTVYNEADEEVRIVLLHNSGSYSNLPHEIAMMIASALNSR
jgi:hypothetical protein